MKKNEKRTLLIIVALALLIVVTTGTTYAIFTYIGRGKTDNILKTGNISFLYTEHENSGNGISITNALPISDKDGKKQFGSHNVFEFSITGTTSGSSEISYELTAKKVSGENSLPNDYVKLYLTEYNGNDELPIATTYNDKIDRVNTYADLKISNYQKDSEERTIYNGLIEENTNNYEKMFRLRMWLNDEIDISPESDSLTGEAKYNNMSFSVKINAYVNDSIITPSTLKLEKEYKLGDKIALLNGKSYHVIKDSSSKDDFVYLFDDINSVDLAFDTTNSNAYDQTSSTNVAYYIKNTLYSTIKDSIVNNGGDASDLEVDLITKDDIDNIINSNEENKSWLYNTNFYTKTPAINDLYAVNDNILTTINADSITGLRVVIKTKKTNILK